MQVFVDLHRPPVGCFVCAVLGKPEAQQFIHSILPLWKHGCGYTYMNDLEYAMQVMFTVRKIGVYYVAEISIENPDTDTGWNPALIIKYRDTAELDTICSVLRELAWNTTRPEYYNALLARYKPILRHVVMPGSWTYPAGEFPLYDILLKLTHTYKKLGMPKTCQCPI